MTDYIANINSTRIFVDPQASVTALQKRLMPVFHFAGISD
jgi:hypothetical protein